MSATLHVYEVRPRKDHRGVDLISDALPFGISQNIATIDKGEHHEKNRFSWLYSSSTAI
jgi:hypothetical protein